MNGSVLFIPFTLFFLEKRGLFVAFMSVTVDKLLNNISDVCLAAAIATVRTFLFVSSIFQTSPHGQV